MGSVIVTSGKQKGEYLPLGRRTSVIGRDEAISLQVLDTMVSRKHLRIWFDNATGRYYAYRRRWHPGDILQVYQSRRGH